MVENPLMYKERLTINLIMSQLHLTFIQMTISNRYLPYEFLAHLVINQRALYNHTLSIVCPAQRELSHCGLFS